MAMSHRSRLARLEEYRRRRLPHSHHLSVVCYPFDCEDRDRWIREELECACGVIGCPLMTIGYLGPAKAPSPDEWSRQSQDYYAQQRALDA